MSGNDYKNLGIDFRVTNKFWLIDEFANTESTNNGTDSTYFLIPNTGFKL